MTSFTECQESYIKYKLENEKLNYFIQFSNLNMHAF
jgi:hypothetical protein